MTPKPVIVTEYDFQWQQDFSVIAERLRPALGTLALAIHHVGSTAVPEMAAKPIIDLDVEIASYEDFPSVAEKLAAIGYIHEGNLGIPGREAFRYQGTHLLPNHHLYICPSDSPELHRHLTFRNYLRSHPEAVLEYSQVKRDAAAMYPNDIDRYIRHKSPCIEKLYIQCGLA